LYNEKKRGDSGEDQGKSSDALGVSSVSWLFLDIFILLVTIINNFHYEEGKTKKGREYLRP